MQLPEKLQQEKAVLFQLMVFVTLTEHTTAPGHSQPTVHRMAGRITLPLDPSAVSVLPAHGILTSARLLLFWRQVRLKRG